MNSTAISNKLQSFFFFFFFRLYILWEHEHVQITRYRWGESGYNWHIMTQFCKITFFLPSIFSYSFSHSACFFLIMPMLSSWCYCFILCTYGLDEVWKVYIRWCRYHTFISLMMLSICTLPVLNIHWQHIFIDYSFFSLSKNFSVERFFSIEIEWIENKGIG